MADKPMPFVVTDRRKFTTEGEARPDADPSPERETRHETLAPAPPAAPTQAAAPPPAPTPRAPQSSMNDPEAAADGPALSDPDLSDPDQSDPELPPAPTPEQMEQSRLAYNTTADRLDVAIRAANPGADHPPAMSFDQLVQSVYMQAILQLGGGTQEAQQPQVDILGARQSIDMLGILDEKSRGNLSPAEQALLSSAIFELRLGFLEITQALARSAQQRAAPPPPPPGPGGPRIVR